MPYTKLTKRCDVCQGKRQLWLGGTDWLECPQCEATGTVEMVQEVVQAKVQERYIPSFAGGYIKRHAIYTPAGVFENGAV